MKRQNALLLLVLTAFFWSLGGLMIKKVNLHPMAIAGWRSAIAAGLLVLWTRKPRFNWSLAQVGCALAYAGNMHSFIAATKLTTAANAILLQYAAPAYVALFGIWYLKEYPCALDWLAVGLTLAGMVLFFMDRLSLAGMWGKYMRCDCRHYLCLAHFVSAQAKRRFTHRVGYPGKCFDGAGRPAHDGAAASHRSRLDLAAASGLCPDSAALSFVFHRHPSCHRTGSHLDSGDRAVAQSHLGLFVFRRAARILGLDWRVYHPFGHHPAIGNGQCVQRHGNAKSLEEIVGSNNVK